LGKQGDVDAFTLRLNDELRKADLFCEGPSRESTDRCVDKKAWETNGIGFLAAIDIRREQFDRILVIRTSVGIRCAFDQSAYAYLWRKCAWQRFWQSEQEIAPGRPYTPQYIESVGISWPDKETDDRLVLTLGSERGCISNFHDVYFRLWRANPARQQPTLLLDRAEYVYLGRHDPPIVGSVGESDASIEFTTTSLDVGVHSYQTVRHYRIDGERVLRIDPIALSPSSFIEEWLKSDWAESAQWHASHPLASLEHWHRKFHAAFGEYIGDTQHCHKNSDLRQVGIAFGDSDVEPPTNVYFLVRWRPPFHFEMVDVSLKPRADCNEPDQDAEDSHRTLFPIQDWR